MYQFTSLGHVREVHKQYIFWIIVRCLLFLTQFLTCFKCCKKEFPTYFLRKVTLWWQYRKKQKSSHDMYKRTSKYLLLTFCHTGSIA